MLFVTISAIILIFTVVGLSMVSENLWKELATLVVLLGVALLLVIGDKLGIPGPVTWIDNLFSPFGRAIYQKH